MISMAEHYLKIPSIPIFAIFQCKNQIRLFDQIRTQHTSLQKIFLFGSAKLLHRWDFLQFYFRWRDESRAWPASRPEQILPPPPPPTHLPPSELATPAPRRLCQGQGHRSRRQCMMGAPAMLSPSPWDRLCICCVTVALWTLRFVVGKCLHYWSTFFYFYFFFIVVRVVFLH
jgi:hypothetical protein